MARARITQNISPKLPAIEIKRFGKWDKALADSKALAPAIKQGYDKGTMQFAKSLHRLVLKCVSTGTPPPGVHWEPKSPKSRNPDNLYVVTGRYQRAISIWNKNGRLYVGLGSKKQFASHSRRSITLLQLSQILANGTTGAGGGKSGGTIPPRPLWNPAFKALGGKKGLLREILKGIRSELLNKGIKANQVRFV